MITLICQETDLEFVQEQLSQGVPLAQIAASKGFFRTTVKRQPKESVKDILSQANIFSQGLEKPTATAIQPSRKRKRAELEAPSAEEIKIEEVPASIKPEVSNRVTASKI